MGAQKSWWQKTKSLFKTLQCPSPLVVSQLCQSVAKLVGEDPAKPPWPGLIPVILECLTPVSSVALLLCYYRSLRQRAIAELLLQGESNMV